MPLFALSSATIFKPQITEGALQHFSENGARGKRDLGSQKLTSLVQNNPVLNSKIITSQEIIAENNEDKQHNVFFTKDGYPLKFVTTKQTNFNNQIYGNRRVMLLLPGINGGYPNGSSGNGKLLKPLIDQQFESRIEIVYDPSNMSRKGIELQVDAIAQLLSMPEYKELDISIASHSFGALIHSLLLQKNIQTQNNTTFAPLVGESEVTKALLTKIPIIGASLSKAATLPLGFIQKINPDYLSDFVTSPNPRLFDRNSIILPDGDEITGGHSLVQNSYAKTSVHFAEGLGHQAEILKSNIGDGIETTLNALNMPNKTEIPKETLEKAYKIEEDHYKKARVIGGQIFYILNEKQSQKQKIYRSGKYVEFDYNEFVIEHSKQLRGQGPSDNLLKQRLPPYKQFVLSPFVYNHTMSISYANLARELFSDDKSIRALQEQQKALAQETNQLLAAALKTKNGIRIPGSD